MDYLVPIDAAHHEPAFFSANTGLQFNIEKVHNVLDFRKADYIVINQLLSDISWDELLISSSVEDNVNKFYEIINGIVVSNVPNKVSRSESCSYPNWYSGELISHIINKKKLTIWEFIRFY